MSDEVPESEGELRRRAAWLLGMLVLVAVLVVIVLSFLLKGGGSGKSSPPLGDNPITATAPGPGGPTTQSASSSGSATSPSASSSKPRKSSGSPSGTSALPAGPKTCPGDDPCSLSGDTGDALSAINELRAQKDRPPITGSITDAAKKCALNQGDGCPSGYALTQLSSADGQQAVKKISEFADFFAPGLKTIQLGWAYDPGAKTYYLSTIQSK